LETTKGVGSTFQLQIPLPQLLIRCVLVRAGDLIFAIPREEIVTTALWSSFATTPVNDPNRRYTWLIQDRDQSRPGLDLLDYWQGVNSARTFSDTAVCIRIRSLELSEPDRDLWLLADDLLEQVDLVIKTLPHPLVSPTGLTGLSMQADGKTIPVLDPSALATQILTASQLKMGSEPLEAKAAALITSDPIQSSSPHTSTILVVDDAALVRRRLEASLANYGYRVQTCRDGLEAWTWLQNHPAPDLMITDIEMPNMDGFTLIDRARQAGMDYPMIVISSRLSEEWSKEASRLGANDYLTKGFSTADLISKVQTLLTT
jgi:CheY-like chemotaxis protein